MHPGRTELTLKLDPYPVGHALDTLSPDRLVELGVEADVGGAHGLLGELDDRLHGMGGALLEGTAVHPLVQVDGVFTGDDVLKGRTRLAGLSFVHEQGNGRRRQRICGRGQQTKVPVS